jgi:hypothetical protein
MNARPVRMVLLAAACAGLLLSACGGGSAAVGPSVSATVSPRPSSPAKLTILSPRDGQVIRGGTVSVRIRLVGAKIVPATTTHITPTQGHLHLFLDDKIVSMNYSTSDVLHDVAPGQHTLRVEFVASDHLPFVPRVFAAVVFEVTS